MSSSKPHTVDEYIAAAPEQARKKLNELRAALRSVAPQASEELKWSQPVFIEKRILFSYAAHKSHLTFMPTGLALQPFRDELSAFKTGNHTVQLPYDQPLPIALIKKIAKYRHKDVMENDARWMY